MDHMAVYNQMANDPSVKKFVATMRDQDGRERKIHLTGPLNAEDATRKAKSFKNYEFVSVEEVARGPNKMQQVPVEAYSNGIKEEIEHKRLR